MAAVLGSAALIAAGCGDDGDSKSSSGSSSDDTTSESADDDSSTEPASDSSPIASPGVDLRVTLDRLLAEHASLAWLALTKTIAGEKDAGAVVTQLQGNTDDLSAAVGSVYGDDAAEAFKTQWEAHIGMFVAYATGVAKKDEAAKAAAKKDLAGYQKSFAAFLNQAAGLDAKAAEGALGMHVVQLTTAVDQFGAGQYPQSYATARTAYKHMFGTGDALSAAITAQKPDDFGTGSVSKATADTRVLVDGQLAEHAFLAAVATTKSLTGAKDAKAAVASLNANTADLTKTIGSVYGNDAAEAFKTQWDAHIGMFVDYTVALATDDDAAKQAAADDLAGYTESFGKFLATATDGDAAAFQGALEEHVADLAGALDAADAGDADQAWELTRDAYAHMYMTGDALVSAIVTQNPDKFPAADDPNPADEGTAGGGDTDDSMEMEN